MLTIGQSVIAFDEPEHQLNWGKRTGDRLPAHNRALTSPTQRIRYPEHGRSVAQALFAFALTRRPERCGVTPRLIHCFHLVA